MDEIWQCCDDGVIDDECLEPALPRITRSEGDSEEIRTLSV